MWTFLLFHGILYTLAFFIVVTSDTRARVKNETVLESYETFARWSFTQGCEGLLWIKFPPAVSPPPRSMFWEQSTSSLERREISPEMDGTSGELGSLRTDSPPRESSITLQMSKN